MARMIARQLTYIAATLGMLALMGIAGWIEGMP